MNIFYLHTDPVQCAKWHCDQHVTKMILEYAQMLSTAHRVCDGEEVQMLSNSGKRMVIQFKLIDGRESHLYKCAHMNHPSNIWVRMSTRHYKWLYQLWLCLCQEFFSRYGKDHSTYKKLRLHLSNIPDNIDDLGFKAPPQCMPDECKIEGNTIQAYRNFYKAHKREFATWKTEIPPWFN